MGRSLILRPMLTGTWEKIMVALYSPHGHSGDIACPLKDNIVRKVMKQVSMNMKILFSGVETTFIRFLVVPTYFKSKLNWYRVPNLGVLGHLYRNYP